jgi:hypothetical protein
LSVARTWTVFAVFGAKTQLESVFKTRSSFFFKGAVFVSSGHGVRGREGRSTVHRSVMRKGELLEATTAYRTWARLKSIGRDFPFSVLEILFRW